jgi:hypothetical protein
MTYVLLAILMTSTPRPATWSAEFSSRDKCVAAGEELKKTMKSLAYYGVTYACVEK